MVFSRVKPQSRRPFTPPRGPTRVPGSSPVENVGPTRLRPDCRREKDFPGLLRRVVCLDSLTCIPVVVRLVERPVRLLFVDA